VVHLKKKLRSLLFIFTVFSALTVINLITSYSAFAQNISKDTIVINNKTETYNISKNITIIGDRFKNKTFYNVLKEYKKGGGYLVKSNKIFISDSSSAYWLIFSIKNNNPLKEKWVLNLGNDSDYITGVADNIYLFSNKNIHKALMRDGRKIKNKIQIIGQRKNSLPLEIKPWTKGVFAIYVNPMAGASLIISPKIEDINYYKELNENTEYKNKVVSAIGFIIILMLLAYSIKYKETTSVILAIYTATQFIIYQTSNEVIPLGNNTSAVYLDLLYAISNILVLAITYKILGFSKAKILNDLRKFTSLLILIIAIIYISGFIIDPLNNLTTYINLRFMPIFTAVFILIIFLIATRKKETPQNIYFEISWVIIILNLVLRESHIFTTAEFSPLDIDIYYYSLLLHLTLLIFSSLSLNSKINLRKEWLKEDSDIKEKIAKGFSKSREISSQNELISIMQKEKDLIIDLKNREAGKIHEMGVAKDAADKANKAKTDFLAVISHEIRTPMTGIMGIINLLKDTKLNKKQDEYVETLNQTGNILLMLLNDILDFSKAEAGRMDIEEIDFDINSLVENVSNMMRSPVSQKGVSLETKISSKVPRVLKGDPARIRQIITNLVSNAIKFTKKGSISISVDLHRTKSETHEIFFSVKDSGIGIPEDVQEKLFKPYIQAGSSISRRFGGTGLGLSICHRLIKAMGGNIEIKSSLGKGSIFYFILPLKAGNLEEKVREDSTNPISPTEENFKASKTKKPLSKTPQPKTSKPAHQNNTGVGKILVVDDNALNQEVIAALLEKDNHDITTVGTVIDAMNEIGRNYFDIIFMDMQMPEINGLAATGMIRSVKDKKKAKTPIIAMTANRDEESISKCIQAGMNDHISKPIDLEQVRNIIKHILGEKDRLSKTLGSALPEPDPEKTKVQQIADLKELSLDVVKEHLNKKTFSSIQSSMDETKLREMVTDLHGSINGLILESEKSLTKKKIKDIELHAHNLCGLCANFGLDALSDAAKQLERQAKNGREIEVLERTIDRLKPVYAAGKKALNLFLDETTPKKK